MENKTSCLVPRTFCTSAHY